MPATVAISSKRKNQCVIVKCAHIQTCLGFTMCPLHTKPLCSTVCSASKSKSGQKKLGFKNYVIPNWNFHDFFQKEKVKEEQKVSFRTSYPKGNQGPTKATLKQVNYKIVLKVTRIDT